MSDALLDVQLGCSLEAHQWISELNQLSDYYEVCKGCGKQRAWTPLWPASAL